MKLFEIVWAQIKVSKDRSRHLQNHAVRSQTLKCRLNSYVIGPLSKCYFDEFLFMRVLHHDRPIKKGNGWERSDCHGLPILCWIYLQEMFSENDPMTMQTSSIRCHIEIHVDFPCILHSHTHSIAPSSVVWSNELAPALPFPPMRVLEVHWSRALSLGPFPLGHKDVKSEIKLEQLPYMILYQL